jgi:hypothetical protein
MSPVSAKHPMLRFSPQQHIREGQDSVAPECLNDVKELQNIETALSVLVG